MLNAFMGYGLYILPCYVLFVMFIGWQLIIAITKSIAVHKALSHKFQTETVSDQQA